MLMIKTMAIVPQNHLKINMMDNQRGIKITNKKNKKNKKNRKRFIAVDVWRSQFGPISVRAIFDVYAQKFNVEIHNMKKYSLQHCINALRLLEDPEYRATESNSSY